MPVGLALGVAVGYRHDDWLTKGQTRLTAGNVEVEGYTYLVRQMRTDARSAADVIDMRVRDDDGLHAQVMLLENRRDPPDFVARIDDDGVAACFIAEDRTIALQRADGQDS